MSTSPARKRASSSGARRRGRPAGRSGQDTRATIIRTAQRLFGRDGFHGVSLQAIADACDLDSRALYHHFPTKRALFDAASVDALDTIGRLILEEVFSAGGSQHRMDSYLEVFRRVHAADPELLGFVGMILVDHRASGGDESILEMTAKDDGGSLVARGNAFRTFLDLFVDDGIAAGEINPDVDREGTVLLFMAIGMGVSLVSTSDPGAFPAMLDTLDLLTKGEFLTTPSRRRRAR